MAKIDMKNIPAETKIYYRKSKRDLPLFGFMFSGITALIFFSRQEYIGGWSAVGIAILAGYSVIKYTKQPQIILNKNGIKLPDNELIKWSEVHSITQETESHIEYMETHLCINFKDTAHEKIKLDNDLNYSFSNIEKLVKIYRKAHELESKQS